MSNGTALVAPKTKQKSPYLVRKIEKKKRRQLTRANADASESDESDEDYGSHNSSQNSNPSPVNESGKENVKQSAKSVRSRKEWEIIEGLKAGQRYEERPAKVDGYLLKRRKWPLKGWHKRYFILDGGILTYAKSPYDIQKGKIHGTVDIGLSVLCFKRSGRRIDLDAEDTVYHLKAKGDKWFEEWVQNLKQHRLYRQHELQFGTKHAPKLTDISSPIVVHDEISDDITPYPEQQSHSNSVGLERKGSSKSRLGSFSVGGQNRLAAWSMDTAGIDRCNKDLHFAQNKIFGLTKALEELNSLPFIHYVDANLDSLDIETPAKKGKSKKFSLIKSSKKEHKKTDSVGSSGSSGSISGASTNLTSNTLLLSPKKADTHKRRNTLNDLHSVLVPPLQISTAILSSSHTEKLSGSASNPNLFSTESDHNLYRLRPASAPESHTHLSQRIHELKLREEFISSAREVYGTLKSLVHTISTEKERLKYAQQQEEHGLYNSPNYIMLLKQQLAETQKQNVELRSKMTQIHNDSLVEQTSALSEQLAHLVPSVSFESTMSAEWFDAYEYLPSGEEIVQVEVEESAADSSSSEDEVEEIDSEEDISESSDVESDYVEPRLKDSRLLRSSESCFNSTGRRTALPATQPSTDFNLWSLLRKNIGKDLSKISMPVSLNEPLSMLQLACEDMEYSYLLDKANELADPSMRMVYVAAFAVSAYAATYYRAGTKPFNPVLGETYELTREDMGWKFLAEQVSHHPPISASYCEGNNFLYWQDARVKTKFWGKSMEIQPHGTTHVFLKKPQEHYTWNKVTSCVHNILTGTRWVDHYGEICIKNGNTTSAKLQFIKASMWSSKKHEVFGEVLDANSKTVQNLFGKWTEGIYCGHAATAKCIWRPGSMPEDYELYYGFSRFAIELNELNNNLKKILPRTDARFRPDQRLLEEGRTKEAEEEKIRVEQIQRETRRQREEKGFKYEPRWFKKSTDENGEEYYEYQGGYWEKRENPKFSKIDLPCLW